MAFIGIEYVEEGREESVAPYASEETPCAKCGKPLGGLVSFHLMKGPYGNLVMHTTCATEIAVQSMEDHAVSTGELIIVDGDKPTSPTSWPTGNVRVTSPYTGKEVVLFYDDDTTYYDDEPEFYDLVKAWDLGSEDTIVSTYEDEYGGLTYKRAIEVACMFAVGASGNIDYGSDPELYEVPLSCIKYVWTEELALAVSKRPELALIPAIAAAMPEIN